MLALPEPVFGLLFGHEWFVEPGVAPARVSHELLPAARPGQGASPSVSR